jgi:hypothetical protein
MPRKICRLAALFAVILLEIPVSLAAQDPALPERATTATGLAIPDVPGAPFSATVVLESERIWPDGSSQIRRTINLIARDSQGRTHNETRRLMPQYFHGSPELMSVRIFDPLTRILTVYEPALHIARRMFVPKITSAVTPAKRSGLTRDLGTTTLNGLLTRGTRRTEVMPDYEADTGIPIEIEDETWYSDDLHLLLLVRPSDSRVGVETLGVSSLKREEPAASLFQVPQGYKILDVTPQAPASPGPPKPPGNGTDHAPPS